MTFEALQRHYHHTPASSPRAERRALAAPPCTTITTLADANRSYRRLFRAGRLQSPTPIFSGNSWARHARHIVTIVTTRDTLIVPLILTVMPRSTDRLSQRHAANGQKHRRGDAGCLRCCRDYFSLITFLAFASTNIMLPFLHKSQPASSYFEAEMTRRAARFLRVIEASQPFQYDARAMAAARARSHQPVTLRHYFLILQFLMMHRSRYRRSRNAPT